jgi:hypothetical protein
MHRTRYRVQITAVQFVAISDWKVGVGAWWQLSRVGLAQCRYGVRTSRPRTLRTSVGVPDFHILRYVPRMGRMLLASRTDRRVHYDGSPTRLESFFWKRKDGPFVHTTELQTSFITPRTWRRTLLNLQHAGRTCKQNFQNLWRSCCSSEGIITWLRAGIMRNRGWIPNKLYFLLQRGHVVSGDYPGSYEMGARGS